MSIHSTGRVNAEVLNALTDQWNQFDIIHARVEQILPGVTTFEVRDSLRSMLDSEGIGTESGGYKGWRKRVDVMPEDTDVTDPTPWFTSVNGVWSRSAEKVNDHSEWHPRADYPAAPLTFTLTITLGNDADTKAVQAALVESALALAREDADHQEGDTGRVVVAGVVVGSWAVA